LVVFVVVLSAARVNPTLHAWLHAAAGTADSHASCRHEPADAAPEGADHRCAVTLLAEGCPLIDPSPALQTVALLVAVSASTHAELQICAPAGLLPAAQAPPAQV
jgi:hypothetical protein